MSPRQQDAYFASRKAYLDNVNTFNYALEQAELKGKEAGLAEGKAEGLAEGLTKGEAKKAVEVARNLKRMGLKPADIAQATNLSITEIERLN